MGNFGIIFLIIFCFIEAFEKKKKKKNFVIKIFKN